MQVRPSPSLVYANDLLSDTIVPSQDRSAPIRGPKTQNVKPISSTILTEKRDTILSSAQKHQTPIKNLTQVERAEQKVIRRVAGKPNQENNLNINNQEQKLLTWFEQDYKKKPRLQPKTHQVTPPKLSISKQISDVKAVPYRSDNKFFESERSINLSFLKPNLPERVDDGKPINFPLIFEEDSERSQTDLEQRIDEYQKKLQNFTSLKVTFRELKQQREQTGDRSLDTTIEQIRVSLLGQKSDIVSLVDKINSLKSALAL